MDTVDLVRTSHPDCGVVILGDFNGVDTSDLNSHHALVQVVRDPTRGYAVLDLIVTNLSHLYSAPVCSAPLGSSDHNVICWKPLVTTRNTTRAAPVPVPKKCYVRRFTQSSIDAFGRWISEHCWFDHIEDKSSVDTLTESFTVDLTTAIDIFVPTKSVKLHPTDKSWMTPSIKRLIRDRQRAYHSGCAQQWRHFKNKVRDEICARFFYEICARFFYAKKVQYLNSNDPRKWWSTINKIAGKSSSRSPISFED